jgi:osmotically inducible lipoprotein OsmB
MNIRKLVVPVCLGFAVATLAPAASRAADENTAQSEQPKPKGGAMKGAAGGAAVGKLSGGSATKGAAVGGVAGAAEKHHSKKKIEKEGHN